MSIHAAIAAMNKEIEAVEKKKARLESMRDALVAEAGEAEVATTSIAPVKGKPGPKPGSVKRGKPGPKPGATTKGKPGPKPGAAKKALTSQVAVAARKTPADKKRVMSAEAKKKIGDAAKARWAAKAATKKTA